MEFYGSGSNEIPRLRQLTQIPRISSRSGGLLRHSLAPVCGDTVFALCGDRLAAPGLTQVKVDSGSC